MSQGIIIQARMGSQRLPGKSMQVIGGQPLIAHVLQRVGRVRGIDRVILATTDRPEDALFAEVAREHGAFFFQGEADNVQKRFLDAALQYGIDLIVRVTGDNPFIEPGLDDL